VYSGRVFLLVSYNQKEKKSGKFASQRDNTSIQGAPRRGSGGGKSLSESSRGSGGGGIQGAAAVRASVQATRPGRNSRTSRGDGIQARKRNKAKKFKRVHRRSSEMAAPPPSYPAALKPEIGPDGLARDSPVIAYTEKVRIPAHPLPSSLDAFLVHQWFSVCWVSGFLLVGWLVRRSFWRSSCS